MEKYDLCAHSHRFASWAAGRAAQRRINGLTVRVARHLIERSLFKTRLCSPDQLPSPEQMDGAHREWRKAIIQEWPKVIKAGSQTTALRGTGQLTHGIAAKLINVYLKARFVHAPYELHERVAALHPPVDKILLKTLLSTDFGGQKETWRRALGIGWSNLGCEEYEAVICAIRAELGNDVPMWKIKQYWQGHQ